MVAVTEDRDARKVVGDAHRSLAADTLEALRRSLLAGEFQPGERLNEVDLANRFAVSRGPIREALHRLAGEGLVTLVPRRGAFVPALGAADLVHLYELRESLEGMAAAKAAERAEPAALSRLRACLSSTGALLEAAPAAPYPADLDLHHLVLEAAGNPRLMGYAQEVQRQITLARRLAGGRPDRARDAFAEHESLVEAIARGEPDRAEALMRHHVRQALAAARETFALAAGPGAPGPSDGGGASPGAPGPSDALSPEVGPWR